MSFMCHLMLGNRIPFFLNYGEFTLSFHKQLLVVLTIKCHGRCNFATAPEEKNIPGSDLLGTKKKDTKSGKYHVVTKQKEYNLEFLPTF